MLVIVNMKKITGPPMFIIILIFLLIPASKSISQYNKNDMPILQFDYKFKQDSVVLNDSKIDDLMDGYPFPNSYVSTISNPYYYCEDINFKYREPKLVLSLRLGNEDYKLGDGQYSCNIENIWIGVTGEGDPETIIIDNIHIESNGNASINPEVLKCIDISSELSRGAIEFQINSIDSYTFTSNIESSIILEMFLVYEQCFMPRSTSINGPFVEIDSPNGIDLSSTDNKGLVTFSWELNQNCELIYHNYQLQILKLYDMDPNTNNYKSQVDWSKAFTFETGNSNTNVSLSMVEGTGFYVWRVRPISNYFDGEIANDRNWGDWSSTNCSNNEFNNGNIVLLDKTNPNSYCCGFYYKQFDADKNWKYVRNFAEGEKGTSVMETMQYADNLLKVRQEQTFISTDSTKLMKQNVYDFVGRNALTTLPVPVQVQPYTEKAHLGYFNNLVIGNISRALYTAENFDLSTSVSDNFKNPESVKATISSEPYMYYSGDINFLNYNTFVPSSGIIPYNTTNFYPFARNLYDQDGTGRIKEQSGFGGNHKIGSDKTVKTYYSGVADDELVPIFGAEAPDAEKVHKIINIDQNGVINYTYQLSNGKILATCLNVKQTNDLTSPLKNLEYNLNETGINSANVINDPHLSKIVNQTFESEQKIGENGYVATVPYTFAEPTDIIFSYTLNPKKINLTDIFCLPYCPTCDYYVTLIIREKESGNIFGVPKSGEISNSAEDCLTPPSLELSIRTQLPSGSYIFERYIYVKNKIPGTDQTYLELYKNELEKKILDPTPDPSLMRTLQSEIFDKLDEIIAGTRTLKEFYTYLDDLVAGPYWSYNETDKIYTYENSAYCCGNITIPKYECPVCEGFPTALYNGKADFEQYLLDNIPEDTPELNELFFDSDGGLLYPNDANYPNGRGAFNQLIENMLGESCYDSCKLWNCWQSIVDNIELLIYYVNPKTGEKILNRDFHLLDHFLHCTGKIYDGPSTSGPYDPDFGYLLKAHKYFNNCITENCQDCKYIYEDLYDSPQYIDEVKNWGADICGNPTTDNASEKKWEVYYKCISRAGKNFVNDYDPNGNVPKKIKDAVAAEDVRDFLDELKSECESNCDSKLNSYIDLITQEYNKIYKSVQGQHHTYNGTIAVTLSESEYWSESAHDILLSTVHCKAAALVRVCKETCPTISYSAGPPVVIGTEYEFDQYFKAKYGYLDIKLAEPACPEGYTNVNPSNVVTFDDNAETIIEYLNRFLQEEILDNLENDSRPYRDTCRIFDNFVKLSKAYSMLLGSKPCFAWLDSCGTDSGGDSTVIFCDSLPYGYKAHYYDPDDSTFYNDFCFDCDEYGQFKKDTTVGNLKILGADRFFQKSVIDLFYRQGIMPNDSLNPYYLYGMSAAYSAASARFLGNWIYAFFPGIKYEFVYKNGKILLKNTIRENDSTEYSYYFYFCCIDTTEITGCDSSICYKWIDELPEIGTDFVLKLITCDEKYVALIESDIYQQIQKCIDSKKQEIEISYKENCLDNIDHITNLSFGIHYYHYTLYYYDRAGNLVRTVPPKGVDINPARNRVSIDPFPNHKYGTSYIYNSLGQMTSTHNPDYNQYTNGTHTNLYYDLKQQLRFSQEPNQKQRIYPNATPIYDYSYTHYDELGRVIESGEFSPYVNETQPIPNSVNEPDILVQTPLTNAYPPNFWKKMIVKTFYSQPAPWLPLPYTIISHPQRNLENRVSFTFRDEDGQPGTSWDQAWTFYSYDAHGNVEWVIHKLPFNIVTKVDYEYDLISGSVKRVMHNENRKNEFFYQYRYDADNRLSEVYTSRHGQIWEKDAGYEFYKHGPLKRIEIGEDKIQGIDYAYTINGWLKAINGSNISMPKPDVNDLGRDGFTGSGEINPQFSFDEFGQLLSYYDNDYFFFSSPLIKYPLPPPGAPGTENLNLITYHTSKGLFNGNISASEFSFGPKGNALLGWTIPLQRTKYGYLYQYDVLGRLKEAAFHSMVGLGSVPPPFDVWNVYSDSAYSAYYRYDANGNMKNLRRLGKPDNSKVLDGLQYNYKMLNGYPSNRLETLIDAGTQTDVIALKNVTHPYNYDHSGNLQTDIESDIDLIEWTPDGKVRRIKKISGEEIVFVYDARGDRVCKANLGRQYDYYLRDANGEILEIITVKFPVISLPSNDPWRIVPGHPFFITSLPPPPQTYLIGEQCPNSPWSALDSVTANWSCWDTTSLDNTFYNLNPFLNVNYQVTHTPEFIALAKNEWYIYGSAGQGRFARAYPHAADERQGYSSELFVSELMDEKRYLKQKQYELKDHLGNVRVVLSDMKIPVNANDTLPPFRADVLAAYSHYPFGMLQPGMYSETGTTYRFGFNGMLRDDEVKDIGSTLPQEEGVGNSYDFGARMYDPRSGRFFRLDPFRTKFPWQSPYLFAGNNPVAYTDKDGKYKKTVNYYQDSKGNQTVLSVVQDNWIRPFSVVLFGLVPIAPNAVEYVRWDDKGNKIGTSGELDLSNIGSTRYCGYINPPDLAPGEPDYRYPPINSLDQAALKHDQAYDVEEVRGASGMLFSLETLNADIELTMSSLNIVKKYMMNEKDPVSKNEISFEQAHAAGAVATLFAGMSMQKALRTGSEILINKVSEMTKSVKNTVSELSKGIEATTNQQIDQQNEEEFNR